MRVTILHIITRMDSGGAAENTLANVLGLSPDEYDVHLAFGRTRQPLDGLVEKCAQAGITLHYISALVREISPVMDSVALFQISRLIGQLQPDIVHTHTSKAGALGRIAAWWQGVLRIMHTPHGHVFYGYSGGFKTRLYIWVERQCARLTHRLIALTQGEVYDHLYQRIGSTDKWKVIHSGVELKDEDEQPNRHEARKRLGIEPDTIAIGSAGRMAYVKGFDLLIEAFSMVHRKMPEARLLLLGEGPEEKMLRQQSDESCPDGTVTFLPWMADPSEFFAALDLYVLPSRNEGMGRVLVEAMMAGTPIVASRVGGVVDVLSKGRCGLLVGANSAGELIRGIRKALEDSETTAKRVKSARKKARRYSKESMLASLAEIYIELMRRAP
jgi:glycosyltransferase involved in cell wall biosynthesis